MFELKGWGPVTKDRNNKLVRRNNIINRSTQTKNNEYGAVFLYCKLFCNAERPSC